MDGKSQETLEFGLILEQLAGFAAFSASKDLARILKPTADYELVQTRQKETSEARYLLSLNAALTVGGAHDIRSNAERASRGIVLEPVDILDIKSTVISARNMKKSLESSSVQAPMLAGHAERIDIVPGLVDQISKVLDDRGKIKDNASNRLASIRQELRIAKERLTTKLQRMISDQAIVPMLQEPIITQRDGRFVIPLRAEFKGRIEAVIHDRSSSGATLFIEPLTVVDLNNQMREKELAERDEIKRLLAELSSLVGANLEQLVAIVEVLAMLDLTFAKAKYAQSIGAYEPILAVWNQEKEFDHPGSTLRLIAARHPLLDQEEVVPLDLILDDEIFALVITGPNTGGKTVALKTTGLIALMAQSGLHIPAESGSKISVFDGIYADIGDEQSIEQSLSTFSSHISNIIGIQELATRHSLVLLDELGAGTDPLEGAALAKAILSSFLDKRVTTLVATHYPELKAYAHTTAGVRNASVEFDLESLSPTFHLTIGLPGRSNALAIAERLGLDREIVEQAKGTISPEELRAESLLDEIHRQKDATRDALGAANEAQEEAEHALEELLSRLAAIDEERREILSEAKSESRKSIEDLHEEISVLRRKLVQAAEPLKVIEDIKGEVDDLEFDFTETVPVGKPVGEIVPMDLRLGDQVHIRTINAVGVITELSSKSAEVQVGRLRIRAKLEELSHSNRLIEEHVDRSMSTANRLDAVERTIQAPPLELDIRGQRVEDALDELEKRLDAAFLAGMPFIRVIHGKGTGKLRKAIREALKSNEFVTSFEPGHQNEGGDGVTMVKLSTS
jgi:DNA mismatch repair protein MutS2